MSTSGTSQDETGICLKREDIVFDEFEVNEDLAKKFGMFEKEETLQVYENYVKKADIKLPKRVGVFVRWCGPFPEVLSREDQEYAKRYGRVYMGKRILRGGKRSFPWVQIGNEKFLCSEPDTYKGVDILYSDGS